MNLQDKINDSNRVNTNNLYKLWVSQLEKKEELEKIAFKKSDELANERERYLTLGSNLLMPIAESDGDNNKWFYLCVVVDQDSKSLKENIKFLKITKNEIDRLTKKSDSGVWVGIKGLIEGAKKDISDALTS